MTLAGVLPPAPVQVSVNVVAAEIVGLVCEPLAANPVPDQPPEAAQDVAFVLDQVSVTVPPLATLLELEVRVTVGAGGVGVTASP